MKLLFAGAALLFALTASALASEVKAIGQANTEYASFIGGPNKDYMRAAIAAAKINALQAYAATFDATRLRLYQRIAATVEGNADAYLVSFSTVDQSDDRSKKIYHVTIEAVINGDRIENEIENTTSAATTPRAQKSDLLFVFVARRQAAVTEYDTRVTTRNIHEDQHEASQGASADGGAVKVTETAKTDQTDTSGGSKVHRSDKIDWDLTSANGLDAAISAKFASAGFEVVDASTTLDTKPLNEDYRHGDDVGLTTLRMAVAALKEQDIQYFAFGTLDIGVKSIDPVSGGVRVVVNVTAKVLDITGKRAINVAAVSPTQVSGIGQDETEATNNALKTAGEKAAQELVDRLRTKEFH